MADFRINFYQNLATLLSAGLPILRAIRTTQQRSLRRYRHILQHIEKDIAAGVEMSESMKALPRLFEPLDVMLVHVGEQTGQLAEILKNLGDWYQFQQKQKRMVLGGLIYPFFMIHMGIFLIPVPWAVLDGGGLKAYTHIVTSSLISLYAPLIITFLIVKLTPPSGFLRRIQNTLVLWIPLLGSAFRCLAIGRYCSVFSIMYKAGIPILRCAELAPQTCGNLAVARLFEGGYTAAKSGQPMSEGFSPSLPPEFLELWSVGEESGDLDKASEKLAEIYLDKALFRFNLISTWTPRLIYFTFVFVMAIMIVKAFVKIYSTMINSLGNF
jgi:type II secretory pathway component PulF